MRCHDNSGRKGQDLEVLGTYFIFHWRICARIKIIAGHYGVRLLRKICLCEGVKWQIMVVPRTSRSRLEVGVVQVDLILNFWCCVEQQARGKTIGRILGNFELSLFEVALYKACISTSLNLRNRSEREWSQFESLMFMGPILRCASQGSENMNVKELCVQSWLLSRAARIKDDANDFYAKIKDNHTLAQYQSSLVHKPSKNCKQSKTRENQYQRSTLKCRQWEPTRS